MPTFRNGLCKIGSRYHYCFTISGKQFKGSTRASDRVTAERVLNEKRREAVLRIQTGFVEPPTVEGLLEQWVTAHSQTLSPGHVLNTKRLINKWVTPTLGQVRIDRVNTGTVLEVQSKLLASGRALPTANLLIRTMKLLWNFAIKMNYIEHLPFKVKLLRVQRKPQTIVPASRVQEFLLALDETTQDPQKRVAVRLALFCGMRISEVMGLRHEWLDPHRKLITLAKTKGKEARQLPVPPWLWNELDNLPMVLSPWMFPGPDGNPRSRVFLNQTLELVAKKMGLGKLTPHRLRGSFASLHSEAGTPLRQLQLLMGHRDLKTLLGYLEESNLEARRHSQDALSARLGLA